MQDQPLNEEELWKMYWKAIEKGETQSIREARDNLVSLFADRKNSLVPRIAWRMIHYLGLNAECLEDLVQDGWLGSDHNNEGLLFAIRNYDPNRGVRFEFYARKYIWYAMLHGNTARNNMTPYQIMLAKKYRNLRIEFENNYHHVPTLPELSSFSGYSIKQLKRMEQAILTIDPKSLDEHLEGAGAEEDIERDIADKNALDPEEAMIQEETSLIFAALNDSETDNKIGQVVQQALNELNNKERQMIVYRFIYEMNHEQIAAKMNISRENARAILCRAIKKLQKHLSRGGWDELQFSII